MEARPLVAKSLLTSAQSTEVFCKGNKGPPSTALFDVSSAQYLGLGAVAVEPKLLYQPAVFGTLSAYSCEDRKDICQIWAGDCPYLPLPEATSRPRIPPDTAQSPATFPGGSPLAAPEAPDPSPLHAAICQLCANSSGMARLTSGAEKPSFRWPGLN